ncbi:MAG TPA: DUF1127 domain-containing protein [Devosiaceae bacterium]|jgi:uncharacterized protein YjiS (DUF1127 family)|nr:DUF1127 domain-containing protein [Devosiaceae bacterium]
MTTIDYHDMTTVPPERRLSSRFGLLRRWLEERRQRRRMRHSMLELSRLDERLLRDMGISHGDIRDALYGRRSSVLLNPIRGDQRE